MSRAERLEAFNSKLQAIKSEEPQLHISTFPDFNGMAQQRKAELDQHRIESERRSRETVEKSHVPKTAADYRGPGATRLTHKVKNEATSASQLSVPLPERKKPEYTEKLERGERLGKKTSDVCATEADARITGRGTNFASQHTKTFRGWTKGCF